MQRQNIDLLIARCGWVICPDEQEQDAFQCIRHALVFPALGGTDIRQLSLHARNMLLSEGRLRMDGEKILLLYEGEDLKKLTAYVDQAASLIKLELYAALISHTSEHVASVCERRCLAVLELADGLIQCNQCPKKAQLFKAAFAHEMSVLLTAGEKVTAALIADRVDHFFSLFSRLRASALFPEAPKRPFAAEVQWKALAPGLRHGFLAGPYRFGPLRMNILEASPKHWRLKIVDARRLPPERRDLATLAAEFGAGGGTNGGYFLVDEDEHNQTERYGEPVGLLISDGTVVNPPSLRRTALLMDELGRVDIWRLGPIGMKIFIGGATVVAHKVNSERIYPGEIVVYTGIHRKEIPPTPLAFTLIGRKVTAVVRGGTLPIPINGLLVAINPGPAELGPLAAIEPGDEVHYEMPPMRGLERITEAIAGGPALLIDEQRDGDLEADSFDGHAPPAAFGPHTQVSHNLMPRTAWGITRNYDLVAVTADGRNAEGSAGIDMDDLARFLRDLGCTRAVHLDGGGSTQMVVAGQAVDRAGDDLVLCGDPPPRRRAMSTAVLLVQR